MKELANPPLNRSNKLRSMEPEEVVLKWKETKTCGEKLNITENVAVIFFVI